MVTLRKLGLEGLFQDIAPNFMFFFPKKVPSTAEAWAFSEWRIRRNHQDELSDFTAE